MQTSFEKFRFEVFESVYEPAEDSFMLAEQVKGVEGELLDVGTGCGIQAIVAESARALGVDLNERAVENARHNARVNCSRAMFEVSDLFENVEGRFDTIAFNPPYLPTKRENLAWDGGENGREVIDRFLREFSDYLKEDGRLLMVSSSLSDNGESKGVLAGIGFETRVLSRKSAGLFEMLSVIEARWSDG